MTQALYGPDGFYTTRRGSAGRRDGDFITSPEVGPLFGRLIGRWLDSVWDDLGRPAEFRVIDLGSGPGTLARSIERSRPRCQTALALSSVDIADTAEAVSTLAGAVVIANELLDNVPFRWVRDVQGTQTEAHVERGRIVWRRSEFRHVVEGEFPLIEQAHDLVNGLLRSLTPRILAFDYGTPTTGELVARNNWLRCYRAHQRSNDPTRDPGHWDITTDVPVDQLPPPAQLRTQAEFLRGLGIEDLVSEGRDYWRAHAARPDLAALEMRSRVNEAQALLDPEGLGGFLALEWAP